MKFPYAACKDDIRKACQPVSKEIQCNDWADLDEASYIRYFEK